MKGHGSRGARGRRLAWLLPLAAIACSTGPETPDWQLDAQGSMQQAVHAALRGDDRVAEAAHARARRALTGTGRADLLARLELNRCAVQVASLQFGPCPAFDSLRADTGEVEQAYADHLAGADGPVAPSRIDRLPAAQRPALAARADALRREAAIRAIDDPLSRLVAAGVALRDGDATPGLVSLAVRTASDQAWRRPLLAWLGVARQRAIAAGDQPGAEALQRRIDLVAPKSPARSDPAAVPPLRRLEGPSGGVPPAPPREP